MKFSKNLYNTKTFFSTYPIQKFQRKCEKRRNYICINSILGVLKKKTFHTILEAKKRFIRKFYDRIYCI